MTIAIIMCRHLDMQLHVLVGRGKLRNKRSRPYKDVNNTELFIVSNNKIASLGRSKENNKSNREESINFYRRKPSTKSKHIELFCISVLTINVEKLYCKLFWFYVCLSFTKTCTSLTKVIL